MALKQDGLHFVFCPKQGNKIEGVVLNRVCILRIFCAKQGQGFKPSAAHLYLNIVRVIKVRTVYKTNQYICIF